MTLQKILCAVDFSECSRQALRVAARVAKEADAELAVAHAWYLPTAAFGAEYMVDAPILQRITADTNKFLDEAVRDAMAYGAPRARSVLLEGAPATAVARELERGLFDLAVVGTHGRTGFSRVMLGSIAEKILRHAPCSVLAVRPTHEPRTFLHALVAVDFSESAQYAVDQAAQLVRPGGAGITLLHVAEVPVVYSGEPPVPELYGALQHRSATVLEEWAAKLRARVTVPVTTRTRIGWAGAEVLAAVDADPSVDLVVTGSHGRTGVARLVLGSVAEKIVRHARTPVFVARHRL